VRNFSSMHLASGNKSRSILLRTLWLSTLAVFLGRGIQHIFFDAPYRALFWDEGIMGGLVSLLGWDTWDSYVTSVGVDHALDIMQHSIGLFFILAFFLTLGYRILAHWIRQIVWAGGTILLVILAFLYFKEKFYALGQFFEYSLQFGAVALLWLSFRNTGISERLLLAIKILIALTFVCHGLYALGYYPRPGHFVQMCIHFFGMSEAGASTFLWWAGALDMLAALFIFLPRPFREVGLGYCVIWGFMTAMARVGANFYEGLYLETFITSSSEALYRFPHFLVPLGLLFYYIWEKDIKAKKVIFDPRPKEKTSF